MKENKNYIDFAKKSEKTVLKNKFEIIKLIRQEVDSYEKYYLTNTFYDTRKVFNESNVNMLVGALDYKPEDFIKELKTFANPNWNVLNDKANMSLLMIAYTFYKNGYDKDVKLITLHLVHRFMSGLIFKYFPYGCKQEVFNYTLNKVSNKFLLRVYNGNVNSLSNFIAIDHIDKFAGFLDAKTDDKFILFILYIRTRINSIIGNFAKEYYENEKAGLKMQSNVTITDESGEDISSFDNDTSVILGLKTKLIDRINSFKSLEIHTAIKNAVGNEPTKKFLDIVYEQEIFKEDFVEDFSEAYIALLFNKKFNGSLCLNDTRKDIMVEFDRKTSTNKVRMILDKMISSLEDTDKVLNENNKKIIRLYVILSYLLYLRQIMCKK